MSSQGAVACQVSHHMPLRAKYSIPRCHCVPSFPWQSAIMCHDAHRKVLLCAYIAYRKVPSCGMMPIARCNRVQNLLCQVAIMWLRCLLRGAMGGYCMVPPYAKFPFSCSHLVPIFAMSRCHRVPMFPMSRCHRVPWSPIACAPCCAQSCPSHGAPPVCQGRFSHITCVCKVVHLALSSCVVVVHLKVLACANVSHVKLPSCAKVAQVNVPSCPYDAYRMVPRVPMLLTAWCLRAPSCINPPCPHVAHHLSPSCAYCLYPYCPSVVPIVCKVTNVNVL